MVQGGRESRKIKGIKRCWGLEGWELNVRKREMKRVTEVVRITIGTTVVGLGKVLPSDVE